MALVKCRECGKEMSSQAKACPHCGAPRPKGTSSSTIIFGAFLVLVVGSCIFSGDRPTGTSTSTSTPKPPPSAADLAKEKEFRTVVAGLRWIKESMKNPKSFELVSARMIDGKALCIEYRGTNSFNAVVVNRRVITDAVNSDKAKDWNASCAGKSGTDYLYARNAL